MKKKRVPLRMCTGCREMKPKIQLVRVVRDKTNNVTVDDTGRSSGRGAYVCPEEGCIALARKNKGLERALGVKIEPELYNLLNQQVKEVR